MRQRLRPVYSDEELKQLYAKPHDHTNWKDHLIRVRSTIALATFFDDAQSVADLACGDAAIVNALDIKDKYLGDYAPGYMYTGPIEKTIDDIPKVDLFICSETLEHIDNPDELLQRLRRKTKYLVLTTPDGETDDSNPEHYWGWDNAEIRRLLEAVGFKPVIYQSLQFMDKSNYKYTYQMWGCE